jgi:acetate kinase
MGMTPLDGLLMGTRTGDLDPAIIFYLVRKGFSPNELDALFNKKSGLLGISEVSNDLRDLQGIADQGHEGARLALAIFAYRVKKYIGAYFAILNGCDAVVFTAGIGENNPRARAEISEGLDAMRIVLDREKNEKIIGGEGTISSESSGVKILVIPTNEEAAIAEDTYALVKNIK